MAKALEAKLGDMKNWRYSNTDSDCGVFIGRAGPKQIIDLKVAKKRVFREVKLLWRRSNFENIEVKDKWGKRFVFSVERNPAQGIYYKQLIGQVYWRYWWEMIETPRGSRTPTFVSEELLGVVLNGKPIERLETGNVSDELRERLPALYAPDLTPLEELMNGY